MTITKQEAKKFWVTALCSTIFLFYAAAQENGNKIARNTFYIESLTKGPDYSINFDHIFRRFSNSSLSYRLGFSIEKKSLSIPASISLVTGTHTHHAEFFCMIMPYIKKYSNYLPGSDNSDTYLDIMPGAGYRLQAPSGKLFLKAFAGPFLILDPPQNDILKFDVTYSFAAGAALGYSF
jgi:hypothetical protein